VNPGPGKYEMIAHWKGKNVGKKEEEINRKKFDW